MILEAYLKFDGGAYEAHRTLEAMFKNPREKSERDYVFAVGNGFIFCRREFPHMNAVGWKERNSVVEGDTVQFVFRGVPMKKLGKNAVRTATKKTPIRDVEGQRSWVESRFAANGFDLGKFQIADHRVVVNKGQTPFSVEGIEVVGWATIADAEKANNALIKGIGEGKAYGFGTIILAGN